MKTIIPISTLVIICLGLLLLVFPFMLASSSLQLKLAIGVIGVSSTIAGFIAAIRHERVRGGYYDYVGVAICALAGIILLFGRAEDRSSAAGIILVGIITLVGSISSHKKRVHAN